MGRCQEIEKENENFGFQIARFANRLKSATNWFENCPARATIMQNPLWQRVLFLPNSYTLLSWLIYNVIWVRILLGLTARLPNIVAVFIYISRQSFSELFSQINGG